MPHAIETAINMARIIRFHSNNEALQERLSPYLALEPNLGKSAPGIPPP